MGTNAVENGPAKFTRHFPHLLDCKIAYHACETRLVLEHVEPQLAFPRTRYTLSLATRISFQREKYRILLVLCTGIFLASA